MSLASSRDTAPVFAGDQGEVDHLHRRPQEVVVQVHGGEPVQVWHHGQWADDNIADDNQSDDCHTKDDDDTDWDDAGDDSDDPKHTGQWLRPGLEVAQAGLDPPALQQGHPAQEGRVDEHRQHGLVKEHLLGRTRETETGNRLYDRERAQEQGQGQLLVSICDSVLTTENYSKLGPDANIKEQEHFNMKYVVIPVSGNLPFQDDIEEVPGRTLE